MKIYHFETTKASTFVTQFTILNKIAFLQKIYLYVFARKIQDFQTEMSHIYNKRSDSCEIGDFLTKGNQISNFAMQNL